LVTNSAMPPILNDPNGPVVGYLIGQLHDNLLNLSLQNDHVALHRWIHVLSCLRCETSFADAWDKASAYVENTTANEILDEFEKCRASTQSRCEDTPAPTPTFGGGSLAAETQRPRETSESGWPLTQEPAENNESAVQAFRYQHMPPPPTLPPSKVQRTAHHQSVHTTQTHFAGIDANSGRQCWEQPERPQPRMSAWPPMSD
jgi:hypothetical protein